MIKFALVVGLLFVSSAGYAYALECPKAPAQVEKSWEVEVNAAITRIGPIKGPELKTKTKKVTEDLMGKLPDAGKIYLEQMMFSAYCSALKDDKTLKESEKARLLKEYRKDVIPFIKATSKQARVPTPAKARLTFTFNKPNIDDPAVHTILLPVKNDIVHIEFCIKNDTKIEARNGEITVGLCKACEFVSAPQNFLSFKGLPNRQRIIRFDRISPISESQIFAIDIKVPPSASSVEFGIAYRCENCEISEPRENVGLIKLVP